MKIVRFSSFKDTEALFTGALSEHEVVFVAEPLSMTNIHLADGAEAIAVFVDCDVSKEVIDALPTVKLIVTESTGVDHIDTAYAKEKGIEVTSIPGYGANAVAEFTFALLLSLSRKVSAASDQIRERENFDTKEFQGFDLAGKTLGVVGTGRIGKHVIEIARGFGMRVIAFDAHPEQGIDVTLGFSYTDLPTLVKEADVITLHVPYLPETHHLVNADMFAKMKHGVVILNTARGEVIDTMALIEALKSGQVLGAGLDVLEGERNLHNEDEMLSHMKKDFDLRPIIGDHVLMHMPNVIVTPHIAFHSKEADQDRVGRAVKAIVDFAAAAG